MRWNAVQGLLDQYSILGESLQQPCGVMIGHYGDFISQLQAFDGLARRAMHLVAEWIETTATINEKQDRERQTVLTEVSDFLSGSVLINLKVLLIQAADNSRGLLFKYQRVHSHQVDVNLDDLSLALGRVFIVGRIRLVRRDPSITRL